LVVGTDAPVAWFFHRELELLVSAGIPPADVIRMATRNASWAINRPTELGTVTRGKIADLVGAVREPPGGHQKYEEDRVGRAVWCAAPTSRVPPKALEGHES
jgi:imidazolonepropionase-like amidohydrolase